MGEQEKLSRQITAVVSDFQKTQMAVSCESIAVDLHDDLLVVTLCGATSPAERDYARDRQAREVLVKFYHHLFDVTKPILEAKIQEIIRRQVRRSQLSVDPESGTGVILLTLAGEDRPE